MFLRENWQMSFHLLSLRFCNYAVLCHTHIFDSDWVALAKNLINEVFRVMVVMAVDYPILCGPCTIINILLFRGNKCNIINCHLLFVLDYRFSHSHCDSAFSVCIVCCMKKVVLKVGMKYTKLTILCKII